MEVAEKTKKVLKKIRIVTSKYFLFFKELSKNKDSRA